MARKGILGLINIRRDNSHVKFLNSPVMMRMHWISARLKWNDWDQVQKWRKICKGEKAS
jgi:hypothetical protein